MGKKIALLVLLGAFLLSVSSFAESLQGEGGWRDYDRDERKDTYVQPSPHAKSDSVRKKAEAGDANAQYILGYMYRTGEGVPQDYKKAAIWTRKAAEQGYPLALCNIGEMYATGQGVPQDYVQSYFWSSLGASRASGDASRQAIVIRDQAAKRLTPEKLMEAQRMTRKWEKSHPRK